MGGLCGTLTQVADGASFT